MAWLTALSPSTAEAQRYRGGYRGRVYSTAGYPRVYYPRSVYPRYYYPRYYYSGVYPGFYYPGFYYPGFRFGLGFGFGYGYGYPGYGYGYGYPGYLGGYGPYPYAPYWFDNSSDVRIQATPRDAEVYVDGRFAGKVDDYDGVFQRLRVEPGGHEITLYHERHQPHTEKLYLSPMEGYKIQHALVPIGPGDPAPPRPVPTPASPREERTPGYGGRDSAPTSRFGTLSIRVQPADAEVFVDGERWHFSDARDRLVIELSEGPHRIEIRKEGLEPYATSVHIRAGEAATLNVSLIKGPGAAAR